MTTRIDPAPDPVLPVGHVTTWDLMPALVAGVGPGVEVLGEADGASQVVVLVLDGFGWSILTEHGQELPNLSAMAASRVVTTAPSTTASGLTSITTGTPPGEHGIVGYRMVVQGEHLQSLRWRTDESGDVRRTLPAADIQPIDPFVGARPTVVTKAEFATTGFTDAHLRGGPFRGYRTRGSLVHRVVEAVAAGDPLVYAYDSGLDTVAHEFGLGAAARHELHSLDDLVGRLLSALPTGVALVVTADHGLVDCGSEVAEIDPHALDGCRTRSGEGRFVWLHARPGRAAEVADAARSAHAHHAWVATIEQVIDEGWLGPRVSGAARARVGDVAVVARDLFGFVDPADPGATRLVGRHGSLTADEMFVPVLTARA